MLPKVAIARYCCSGATHPDVYRDFVGDELMDEIFQLASELKGLRVCEINATAAGGGVAEVLSRQVPIYRSLGLNVDWCLIYGDKEFFTVTKAFHNALQGTSLDLTEDLRQEYLQHNRSSAEAATGDYDIYVVHDPQPAALRRFVGGKKGKWIWRCHIDSSQPNREVWEFLRPFIADYDVAVFTLKAFLPGDLGLKRVAFIPPAIDPLSTKNMELPETLYRQALAEMGVDMTQPSSMDSGNADFHERGRGAGGFRTVDPENSFGSHAGNIRCVNICRFLWELI